MREGSRPIIFSVLFLSKVSRDEKRLAKALVYILLSLCISSLSMAATFFTDSKYDMISRVQQFIGRTESRSLGILTLLSLISSIVKSPEPLPLSFIRSHPPAAAATMTMTAIIGIT